MAFEPPIVYGAPMSRLMSLSIAIILSLLPPAASAARIHKRPVAHWHGYGFLPGYRQPPNNAFRSMPRKRRWAGRAATDVPGISIRPPVITAMMATGTIRPARLWRRRPLQWRQLWSVLHAHPDRAGLE